MNNDNIYVRAVTYFFLVAVCLIIFILGYLQFKDKEIRVAQDLQIPSSVTVAEKKLLFFSFMIPIVQAENLKIRAQRSLLKKAIANKDTSTLLKLQEQYNVDTLNVISNLLLAIDEVPLELVVAQSANESEWGASRFARQGNNFFGEWCFSKGCGIVPSSRTTGSHEVRSFPSVNASVGSYIHNINTHRAYILLRKIRFSSRQKKEKLNASDLAEGLILYSERKHEYVEEIQAMIRHNHTIIEDILKKEHNSR